MLIDPPQDTNEKPFACPHCGQSFQRSDVRALHVKKIHGIEFNALDVVDGDTNEPSRKRVKTACDLCRKRKLRCDGECPCRQCRTGNADCHYHGTSHVAPPASQEQQLSHATQSSTTRTEREFHVSTTGTGPASVARLESNSTFNDPSFLEGILASPLVFDIAPDDDLGMSETTPRITNAVAGLDTSVTLQHGVEDETTSEFWQLPLLVIQSFIACRAILTDKLSGWRSVVGQS